MMNSRKNCPMMLAILTLAGLMITAAHVDLARAEAHTSGTSGEIHTEEQQSEGHLFQLREFIKESGQIGYVILALLGVGVLALGNELRLHWVERLRGAALYGLAHGTIALADVSERAEKAHPSKLASVFDDSLRSFRASGNANEVNAHAEIYRETEESRHSNFQNRLAYISDAAGGLGLLGTVLGIYNAFKVKGTGMDERELLAAMGLALGTTFLGILVSLMLNMLAGEMGAAVNRRILCGQEKLEMLRDTLMIAAPRGQVLTEAPDDQLRKATS